jgi:hypothetical protein
MKLQLSALREHVQGTSYCIIINLTTVREYLCALLDAVRDSLQ